MRLMTHLRRILGYPRTTPVTASTVVAAQQDPEMERRVRASTAGLVHDVMRAERSGVEVRRALAAGALDFAFGGGEK